MSVDFNDANKVWAEKLGLSYPLLGDTRRHRVDAGSFVFVPRGTPHAFCNPGPNQARILVIGSPPVQAMVEEVGRLATGGPPDPKAVAEVFERFDSELRLPASS